MANKRNLLVLWITGSCNLSCRYCYAAGRSGAMTQEIARAALDRYREIPVTIQFAGGEPLLNWELIPYVTNYVQENQIDARLQIQTNGTCLTREMAAFFREHQIAVGVSLDGIPSVNERLRGKTAQVINGIQLLAAEGLHCNLNAVVTAENADQLEQMVDFAWYLESVEGIGLDLLRAAGRGREAFAALLASEEQIRSALWQMETRSRQLEQLSGRKIVIREVADAVKRMKYGKRLDYCYAASGLARAVLPDGSCYPCGSLAGIPEYAMGNITETACSICLKSEKTKEKEWCRDCPGRAVCPGACPSREILNGADERDCILRRTAFEIAEKWYV